MYKILCLDGGGIRGIFAIEVLRMLQEELGDDVLKHFDCFSGTSTGALIVAALMRGFRPTDISRFYALFGRKIFPKRRKGITSEAKYSPTFLHALLQTSLLNMTLSDIEKHVIIPTCRLEGKWEAEIYDNYDREMAKEMRLVDVALQSAAAPIYFPSYQNHIDGGLYALNPSSIALSRAIDPKKGGRQLGEIRLLSIGNGISPVGIDQEVNWGVEQWMTPTPLVAGYPLVSIMTDIGATVPDYPLKQLLPGRYLRINARLPEPVEIDDSEKIPLLIESARSIKSHHPEAWRRYVEFVAS